MGSDRNVLRVRVNGELTLDAGWWEERDEDGACFCQLKTGAVRRYIHPPEKTMFEQVIEYLESFPPPAGYPSLRIGQEAIAATAVCLRWGSYLAVLADHDKPIWPQARQQAPGRITDSEMARINIEASAAMAQWIDIMRDDWQHYLELMWAAQHLPMTRRSVPTNHERPFLQLTDPNVAAKLAQSDQSARARAEVEIHPSRVLANSIIHACWRNGPVENIHAGESLTLPLLQRRITPSEERTLVRDAAGHLAQAILAVFRLTREQSERSWAERVLPFNVVAWIRPWNWSLDEQTRQVWLSGAEPSP